MTKVFLATCSALLLGSSGLFAQTGAMPMHKDMDMSKEMKVTGCVAESSEAGHFMLNNATMPGDKAMGDHAMKGMEMKPMSFTLTGGELKPHVGHKVEVTGMMGAGKMMGKDTPNPDTAAKETKDMSAADMHTLTVKSVKMISPNCN